MYYVPGPKFSGKISQNHATEFSRGHAGNIDWDGEWLSHRFCCNSLCNFLPSLWTVVFNFAILTLLPWLYWRHKVAKDHSITMDPRQHLRKMSVHLANSKFFTKFNLKYLPFRSQSSWHVMPYYENWCFWYVWISSLIKNFTYQQIILLFLYKLPKRNEIHWNNTIHTQINLRLKRGMVLYK